MEITLTIPDDLVGRFGTTADLGRRALESLFVEEYRLGRLTRPELGRALGLGRIALDAVLKAHEVYESCTPADIDRELEALVQLGI